MICCIKSNYRSLLVSKDGIEQNLPHKKFEDTRFVPDFSVENNLGTLNLEKTTISCDCLHLPNSRLWRIWAIAWKEFPRSYIHKLPPTNKLQLYGWDWRSQYCLGLAIFTQLTTLKLHGYDFPQSVPSGLAIFRV